MNIDCKIKNYKKMNISKLKFYLTFVFAFLSFTTYAQKEFEKDVTGFWKVDVKATKELTALKKSNPVPDKILENVRFEFAKDGKYRVTSADKNVLKPKEGTWSVENSVITIKLEKEFHLNIVGVDLFELRIHDVDKNNFLVLITDI